MADLSTKRLTESFMLGTAMAKSKDVEMSDVLPKAIMSSMFPNRMMAMIVLSRAVDDLAEDTSAQSTKGETALDLARQLQPILDAFRKSSGADYSGAAKTTFDKAKTATPNYLKDINAFIRAAEAS